MKGILKGAGILLIMCGVVLYLLAGAVQDRTKPQKVEFGYTTNGTYVQTGSGYLGGNAEGSKTMDSFKTMGVAAGIGGVVALIVSGTLRDEQ